MVFKSILIEIKFLLLVGFDKVREANLRKIFSNQSFRLWNPLGVIKWCNILFFLLNYRTD